MRERCQSNNSALKVKDTTDGPLLELQLRRVMSDGGIRMVDALIPCLEMDTNTAVCVL